MIYSQFGFIFLFILAGLVLLTIFLFTAKLLRPSKPSEQKLTTYESGEDNVGNAKVAFNSKYYVIALIFLLFEVELVLLFPWSTVFGNAALVAETKGSWGWFSIAEMFIFLLILAVGLVYVWAQGHLDWIKPNIKKQESYSNIPKNLYEQINKKYE